MYDIYSVYTRYISQVFIVAAFGKENIKAAAAAWKSFLGILATYSVHSCGCWTNLLLLLQEKLTRLIIRYILSILYMVYITSVAAFAKENIKASAAGKSFLGLSLLFFLPPLLSPSLLFTNVHTLNFESILVSLLDQTASPIHASPSPVFSNAPWLF